MGFEKNQSIFHTIEKIEWFYSEFAVLSSFLYGFFIQQIKLRIAYILSWIEDGIRIVIMVGFCAPH